MLSKKCGFSYGDVKIIARDFSDKVGLFENCDVIDLINRLDIKIQKLSIFDLTKTFFVKITKDKKYELNLPIGLDEKQERFFMSQCLGHIVLHLDRNVQDDVIVRDITKDETSQESLWFALELLVPDNVIENYLEKTNEELSNLFRVPINVIEMKRAIKQKQKELINGD